MQWALAGAAVVLYCWLARQNLRHRRANSALRESLRIKESQLQVAREHAQVAEAAKTAFLANMSHEIRTPLGVVLGFAELLVTTQMSLDEKKSTVETIQRNGMLLANVINDILDLSKVEAGRLNLDHSPTSLQDVIFDLQHLLAIEAAEKGLRLSIHPEGFLPRSFTSDPLRLRQVLQNIVGNAIKFTNRGFVDVVIRYDESYSGKLFFTVRDSGVGIEAAGFGALFSPFTQGDITATRRHGGTGLGLVLAKKLAQAMGGDTVLVESQLGVGSTFRVSIDPGAIESLDLVSADTFRVDTKSLTPPRAAPLQFPDAKILLVEDSPDNQALIGRILRSADISVEVASNGREGVDCALKNQFDLIFMDLQMPVLDGYAALAELRAKGYDKPIVALTAHAMGEEIKRCIDAGFSAHLSKPIDRPLLFATLLRFIETPGTLLRQNTQPMTAARSEAVTGSNVWANNTTLSATL